MYIHISMLCVAVYCSCTVTCLIHVRGTTRSCVRMLEGTSKSCVGLVAVCCSVMQCGAVRCSVLQCVAVTLRQDSFIFVTRLIHVCEFYFKRDNSSNCKLLDRLVAERMHARICTHMHTYAHICTHMHTYAHICTHMHTYSLSYPLSPLPCSIFLLLFIYYLLSLSIFLSWSLSLLLLARGLSLPHFLAFSLSHFYA